MELMTSQTLVNSSIALSGNQCNFAHSEEETLGRDTVVDVVDVVDVLAKSCGR